MTLPAETVLYASDDSTASIAEAREYIRQHSLTQDDVRLLRKSGSVVVISRRDIALTCATTPTC